MAKKKENNKKNKKIFVKIIESIKCKKKNSYKFKEKIILLN